MNIVSVFCLDNSELSEFEAINRGYRGDIYVRISKNFYHLNVYDIIRLKQDFDTELEEYGVFSPEPNLILAKEVSFLEIIKVVINLHKQKYFEDLKSLSPKEVQELDLKLISDGQ